MNETPKKQLVARMLGGPRETHNRVHKLLCDEWPPRIIQRVEDRRGRDRELVFEHVKGSNVYVFRGPREPEAK